MHDTADKVVRVTDASGRGGWYPDPTGRYEFRWYNGERWTADVSVNGRRFVDAGGPASYQPGWGPLPPSGQRPSRGLAVASFVIALVSLLLAWIPFVFVIAAIGVVLALVFGIAALRKREVAVDTGRGFAIAGVILSLVGAALCVLGGYLSVLVWREVQDASKPGPNRATIEHCTHDSRLAVATGRIENLDDHTHSYVVTVRFATADGEELDLKSVRVDSVAAGRSDEFLVSTFVDPDVDVRCSVYEVRGPSFFDVPAS